MMNGVDRGDDKINGSYPLNTSKLHPRAIPTRVFIVIYTCALISLFYHHSLHLHRPIYLSLPLITADFIFAFMWVLSQAFRWRPITRKVYPENLSRFVSDDGLPRLDVFICTADPYKEPPIDVANTVLSVLAFDYPTDKLCVYVSDDGGSEMSLFAMMEAAKFAKVWLPFVKGHQIRLRCPKAFFQEEDYWRAEVISSCSQEEFDMMKKLYDEMKAKVENVMQKGHVEDTMIHTEEERKAFEKWTNGFSRRDHPTVIQVISESAKDSDATGRCLPSLVYVSREKSKDVHHKFKAGALNVLLRVSAVMTNAPVILSLDCDMYCNDPQVPRKALCHLLDPVEGPKLAYVQFPQRFRGINKGDIYNNENYRPFIINSEGLDGLGVVNCTGTGPFFNRKAFYGGPFEEVHTSTANFVSDSISSKATLAEAYNVASCIYEEGTNWGLKLGFKYGTLVEDFFTGYLMHCEGWNSILCNPETPAFLGDFPISLSDTLTQLKRWSIGLIEVFFSKYCPLIYGTRRRSVLMGFGSGFYSLWPILSIPLLIYGFLPQLALLNNVYVFPKVSTPWFYLYSFLFVASYIQDVVENLLYGMTLHKWWNEQRIWLIRGVTSFSFALLEFIIKLVGLSAPDFSLTNKVIDNEQQKQYDQGIFHFGADSPFFVMLSTIALLNLASFTWGIMMLATGNGTLEDMFAQLFLSGFVIVNSLPLYEAMALRSDGGRMPTGSL